MAPNVMCSVTPVLPVRDIRQGVMAILTCENRRGARSPLQKMADYVTRASRPSAQEMANNVGRASRLSAQETAAPRVSGPQRRLFLGAPGSVLARPRGPIAINGNAAA
jgi:hypothetical protein